MKKIVERVEEFIQWAESQDAEGLSLDKTREMVKEKLSEVMQAAVDESDEDEYRYENKLYRIGNLTIRPRDVRKIYDRSNGSVLVVNGYGENIEEDEVAAEYVPLLRKVLRVE